MDAVSQVNPLSRSISPLYSEQIKTYQNDIWEPGHFSNAIKWGKEEIEGFLRDRCMRIGIIDEKESASGVEDVKTIDNEFSKACTISQEIRSPLPDHDKTDPLDIPFQSVLAVRDGATGCIGVDGDPVHSDISSIRSMSCKDEGSNPSTSTTPEDRSVNGDRVDSSGTTLNEEDMQLPDRQLSDRQLSDLKNLWENAIKPYFANWKKENHGTVLVKKRFEVRIHGKDIEIFSIFCAIAAVLSITPLKTPKKSCSSSPNRALTVIQYQWLFTTLLGKWVITIAAKRFPTVFCVMSRQIGEDTIYVWGTTKPKLSPKYWSIKEKDAMTESRHALVDKALGEHPLELHSLEYTHDENEAKQMLISPLGTALQNTKVKEITVTGPLEDLFQEIWGFVVVYKEGERRRREEAREGEAREEEEERQREQIALEVDQLRRRNEEKEKRRLQVEKEKKEKKARGEAWKKKLKNVWNQGQEFKRKKMSRGERSQTLLDAGLLKKEKQIHRKRSPKPDNRVRKVEPNGVVSKNIGIRRKDEGQQRIGDCAEVWGLATLVGLEESENANGEPGTLLSVSIDAKTIKTIELANCIDYICSKTAGSKPACEVCLYTFNVVLFKSGTKSVDDMYPDGKRRDRVDSSGCTGVDCWVER